MSKTATYDGIFGLLTVNVFLVSKQISMYYALSDDILVKSADPVRDYSYASNPIKSRTDIVVCISRDIIELLVLLIKNRLALNDYTPSFLIFIR